MRAAAVLQSPGCSMNQFKCSRMPFINIDPGDARVIDLLEELLQAAPSFMVYKGISDQLRFESVLQYPDAQFYIFTETHFRETSCCVEYLL